MTERIKIARALCVRGVGHRQVPQGRGKFTLASARYLLIELVEYPNANPPYWKWVRARRDLGWHQSIPDAQRAGMAVGYYVILDDVAGAPIKEGELLAAWACEVGRA